MDGDELDRLAARASRADYRSMVRLARALYETGLNEREVLRRCFGFELPDEFFAIAAEPELFDDDVVNGVTYVSPLAYSNQPWQLAVPLARGGPDPEPDGVDRLEQWLLAVDPKFVPLLDFTRTFPVAGGHLYCYHLDELRAGRTTVFGVPPGYDGKVEPVRLADSLLSVLHERFASAVRELERENAHESNRGAGSVVPEEIDVARRWLERVERVRRRLAAVSDHPGRIR